MNGLRFAALRGYFTRNLPFVVSITFSWGSLRTGRPLANFLDRITYVLRKCVCRNLEENVLQIAGDINLGFVLAREFLYRSLKL